VTSLSTSFLLGPEMADFGFSVAGVALAEGDAETKDAYSKLREALVEVRTAFDAARPQFRNFEALLEQTADEVLQGILDRVGALEGAFANGSDKVRRFISPKRQTLLLAFAEGHLLEELNAFVTDTRRDYIPTIRRLRMLIIKYV
jgi:hypothetical protein